MPEDNKTLRQILGLDSRPTAASVTSGLSAVLFGAGLLDATGSKPFNPGKVSYASAAREGTGYVAGLVDSFNKNFATTDAAVTADYTNNGSRIGESIAQSAAARAIPSRYSTAARSQFQSTLGGAYASARAAMAKAKLESQNILGKARTEYYTNMAEKSLKAALEDRARKMGLIGALSGGAAGAILERAKRPAAPIVAEARESGVPLSSAENLMDYKNYLVTPKVAPSMPGFESPAIIL